MERVRTAIPTAAVLLGLVTALAGCGLGRREVASVPPPAAAPAPAPAPLRMKFTATAYTIAGTTASGAPTRERTCAADPAVLPFGSRIRVEGAGRHSGEYLVQDSGRKIGGREIDLYIADDAEAKRFGRRGVTVELIRTGAGRPEPSTDVTPCAERALESRTGAKHVDNPRRRRLQACVTTLERPSSSPDPPQRRHARSR